MILEEKPNRVKWLSKDGEEKNLISFKLSVNSDFIWKEIEVEIEFFAIDENRHKLLPAKSIKGLVGHMFELSYEDGILIIKDIK